MINLEAPKYFHHLPSAISEASKKCSIPLVNWHFWQILVGDLQKGKISGADIFENMAPIENLNVNSHGPKSVKELISGAYETLEDDLDPYLINFRSQTKMEISQFYQHFCTFRGVESSAGPEISTGSNPKFNFDLINFLLLGHWTHRSEYFWTFAYYLETRRF